MWDFSWLLRRDHDEAEYAEVARVLAELADRGYDVVRIDAFPHWVASDRNGGHSETITSIPQPELCMWGNHRPVDVRPRAALLGLALERGWQGICTSNFSQPHHRELWGDVGWHRRLTDRIRSNDPTSCLRH
jgi:hypothetical protein